MKKYLAIIKAELQKQFTYRYEIASYVPGNFFELFFSYLLWTIIYQNTEIVKGYTYQEMITYVIIGWIFSFLTSNYNYEGNIARDIYLGRLTNYLVKPISYLKFKITSASARVVIALFFIIFQSTIYISLFHNKMLLNINIEKILILLTMMIFAFFIKLFISILTGLSSFWITEVNGFQAFIELFIKFFSGAFFPLALLPLSILKISYFLPFIYTFFIPVQFFLDKISLEKALLGIGVQFVWCLLLYIILKITWKLGLKKYEGYGI